MENPKTGSDRCAELLEKQLKYSRKKEPPGKTGGSSYAGIALCSSRDT